MSIDVDTLLSKFDMLGDVVLLGIPICCVSLLVYAGTDKSGGAP
jgi:hypothetical protein